MENSTEAYLAIVLSFPTVVFSIMLGVTICLSLISMLGVFDFDADIDVDVDVDASEVGGFTSFISTMGFTGVPIMFVLTILSLTSWVISYTCVWLMPFGLMDSVLKWPIGAAILVGSVAIAMPVTSFVIRPLKKFFRNAYAPAPKKELVGKTCRVRSSRVDEHFGEGDVQAQGASLIIQIRSNKNFKTNDQVVIIEKLSDAEEIYQVVSEEDFKQQLK